MEDPVGPDNDAALLAELAAAGRSNSPVVAAWGAATGRPPQFDGRVAFVLDAARRFSVDLRCLGVTAGAHPRHPLYAPAASVLLPFPA